MAAADEAELVHMVATAAAIDDRPSAFRYPRGDGVGVDMPEFGVPLEIGKGRIIREGSKVALLSLGTRLPNACAAAEELAALRLVDHGGRRAVRQAARHRSLIQRLAREHEVLITVEEGVDRRLRRACPAYACREGLLENGLKVRSLVLPDVFVDHDTPTAMYARAGLDATASSPRFRASAGIRRSMNVSADSIRHGEAR